MQIVLRPYIHFLLFVFFLSLTPAVSAQEGKSSEGSTTAVFKDPYGRNTPRGTVNGFISAISSKDYELASKYLNLSKNTGIEERKELARAFQHILDVGHLISFSRISHDSLGKVNDGLEPNLDKVGTVQTATDSFDVIVERIKDTDENSIWLFSKATLKKVAKVKVSNDALLIDKMLPPILRDRTWGGAPIGHWIAMLIMIVAAYFIAWGVSVLFFLIMRFVWRQATTEPIAGIILALTVPLRIYVAVWLFVYMLQKFGVSIILKEKIHVLTVIVGIGAILMFFWRLNKFVGKYSNHRMMKRGNSSGASVIIFLQRFFQIIIIIIGIFIILYLLGVNVTAGVAAFGIGGIALALGAQKSMENFVGSVTLIVDQPLRVGDYCRIGNVSGTVEGIGMRSTRIRTSDRTVVTIPNGKLSSDNIENYAPRDKFLFNPAIELRLETTPDQIRYLLVQIRTMLHSHPKITSDIARVRFTDITDSAIKLSFYTFVIAGNLAESLAIKEDLLLRIMDIIKESGTDFAYPSQTLYITRDSGVSAEKTSAAEDKVKEWKRKNELGNPEFTAEHIEKVKDSLTYPPTGSETSDTSSSQTKLDIDN